MERGLEYARLALELKAEQLERLAEVDDLSLLREAKKIDDGIASFRARYDALASDAGLTFRLGRAQARGAQVQALALTRTDARQRRETLLAAASHLRHVLTASPDLETLHQLTHAVDSLPLVDMVR
jgi:hypothetical protein